VVLRDAGEVEPPDHPVGRLLSPPEQARRNAKQVLSPSSAGRWDLGRRAAEAQLPSLLYCSRQVGTSPNSNWS